MSQSKRYAREMNGGEEVDLTIDGYKWEATDERLL